MKNICMLFIMLFFAASVYADNLTVKGKIYKDYEITGCSADGIEVSHSDGIVIVAPENWPPDRQAEIAKYKNQIEKLKRVLEQQKNIKKVAEAKKAKENKFPASAQCLIFKVIGVENGSVLGSINAKDWMENDLASMTERAKAVSGFAIFNKYKAEVDKTYSNSSQATKDEKVLKRMVEEIQGSLNIVYVTDIDTSGVTDDQQLIIAGIRTGTHKYTAVNGATRTVPKFSAVK
jgi:hypothetical protein